MTGTSKPKNRQMRTREYVISLGVISTLAAFQSVLFVAMMSGPKTTFATLLNLLPPILLVASIAAIPTALFLFHRLMNYRTTKTVGVVCYATAFTVSFFLCSALGIISMNFYYLFHLLFPSVFLYFMLKEYTEKAVKRGDPIY